MTTRHQPKDYLAIAMWGKQLHSFDYYITGEQARAAADQAPIDAVYRTYPNNEWRTVRDLAPDHHFRLVYEKTIKEQQP